MNITSGMISKHWDTFAKLEANERDEIIHKGLFIERPANIPRFSGHISFKSATDDLITKLEKLGCSKIQTEYLPRSTKSIVTIDGNRLNAMPRHKAVAFIGYMVAKEAQNDQ